MSHWRRTWHCLCADKPLLAVDFDKTVTQRDTTALIGRLGGHQQAYRSVASSYWKLLAEAKREQHVALEAHLASRQGDDDITSVLQAFVRKLCEVRRQAEQHGRTMLIDQGCFSGVKKEHLRDLAQRTALRDEWVLPTIRQAMRVGHEVHIISLNLSRHFVSSVLPELSSSNIHCNDIPGVDTGDPAPPMLTGADKLNVFERLRRAHSAPAIYIGDSDQDLPCLLHADLGILIGDDAHMHELCARLGIALRPKEEWTCGPQGDKGAALMIVNSWYQVYQFLFDPHTSPDESVHIDKLA